MALCAAFVAACGVDAPAAGAVKGASASHDSPTGIVRVGVAASLRPLLDALAADRAKAFAGLRFEVQSGGSQVLVRKATELGERFDVLVLADPVLLEQLQPSWSSFHVLFATDRLVVARGTGVAQDALSAGNAHDVLLQDGVVLGMANPELAPLGYRTQLSWLLAQEVLARPGLAAQLRAHVEPRHIYPDASALLAPLQTGEIDYAVMYGAAVQAAGIGFVELPLSMNLGDFKQSQAYARVQVAVQTGAGGEATRTGAPIVYGASIASASENPAGAHALLAALLSRAGDAEMRRRALRPYSSEAGRWQGSPPEGLRDRLSAGQ